MAQGFHWQPSEILQLSETQLVIATHASRVNYDRDEERRRIERTCEKCGEEQVHNDKCSACQAVQWRSNAIIKGRGRHASDTLIWKGKHYVGDEEESAQMKFKEDDPEGFIRWMFEGRK